MSKSMSNLKFKYSTELPSLVSITLQSKPPSYVGASSLHVNTAEYQSKLGIDVSMIYITQQFVAHTDWYCSSSILIKLHLLREG